MLRQCFLHSARIRAGVFASKSRSTCVMGRKYPYLEPSEDWHNGKYPELPERHTIWEVKEHSLDRPDAELIDVLLTGDVPGLGEIGNVLKVNRQRFWRFLSPLKLAELPTPERVEQLAPPEDSKPRILRGDAFYTFKRLEKTSIHIPMNPDLEWKLTPNHVKVALRRVGIKVDEENILLPDGVITEATSKPFSVQITINDIATVSIKCSIFFWTKLDAVTVTKPPKLIDPQVTVENWLIE